MYKELHLLNSPPFDAVLWRYMDFTKFVSLLHKSALFFARADRLGDPFEGSYTRPSIAMRRVRYGARIPDAILDQISNALWDSRAFTLVNCWHWRADESAAMWKLYSRERDGIAIKTTFGSFSRSFECADDIFIGTVSYVDYGVTAISSDDLRVPYFLKRKSFEHESEVRALTQDFPSPDGVHVDMTQPVYDVGTYYEVDLSFLVEEVVVAPYAEEWFMELVQAVASRYNLKAPIRKSSLADPPIWSEPYVPS